MVLITTILTAVAIIAATIVLIEVAFWTFEKLVEWFNSIDTLSIDTVGFTIKEAERTGQVNYIQGVLNKRTNEIIDIRRIQAQGVDKRIEEAHRTHKVTIYD